MQERIMIVVTCSKMTIHTTFALPLSWAPQIVYHKKLLEAFRRTYSNVYSYTILTNGALGIPNK